MGGNSNQAKPGQIKEQMCAGTRVWYLHQLGGMSHGFLHSRVYLSAENEPHIKVLYVFYFGSIVLWVA